VAKEEETPSPATDGKGPVSQDATAGGQDAATAPPQSNSKEALIGGLVWLAIGLAVAFIWLRGNVADVYLDVSPKDPRALSGVVLYDGSPVASGRVVVETWEPAHRRLIGSAVVEVAADGKFEVKPEEMPAEIDGKKPLRIVASYDGSVKPPGKDDAAPKQVSGDRTLYLNQSPPVSTGLVVGAGVLLVALLGSLVYLFTLELTQGRARTLFRLTYVVILVALSVPIVMIAVATRSEQVVTAMEQAPVGLVRGRSEAVKKAQWLVNIGGAVRSHPPGEAAPPAEAPAAPPDQGDARAEEPRPEDRTPYVEGGLVVPFFVLILALLGGAINMTMKVPTIQKRYQVATLPRVESNVLGAIAKGPMRLVGVPEAPVHLTENQAMVVSGIRRSLISQYMFLLSAPFLAIAVYYLLQVVAREVEEPVLVLMSFATGIVSDKIVNGISEFAEGVLQTLRRGRGGADRTEEPKVAAGEAATKT
jgi:hypothetical protein